MSSLILAALDTLIGTGHTVPGLRASDTQESHNDIPQLGGLSMRTFLEARCPSLFKRFQSTFWLPNGHLQTIYCSRGDFSKVDQVVYDRKFLRLKDGGTLGLDFTPPYDHCDSLPDDTPIVILLHGLTGGSHEAYVRNVLVPTITPVKEGGLGYRGVVINCRGCGDTPITSPQFYSASNTDDIRQAIWYLSTICPSAPLLAVGFSMGANAMIRYLAEEGSQCRLISACSLACPWNLWKSNRRLEDGWLYQNLYSRRLGSNLVTLHKRHLKTLQKWPDHPVTQAVTAAASLKSAPHIREFDDLVTRVAGGTLAPHGPFPYKTVYDYYTLGSSDHVLPSVRTPLLCINSGDDPLVRALPLNMDANPYIALMVTSGGGHLGWFSGRRKSGCGLDRWVTQPVVEWLRATAMDRNVKQEKPARLYTDSDGWITEAGKEHLGVMALEGMERVDGAKGQEGVILQGL